MRAGVHKPLVLAQPSGLHDVGMALQLVCAVLISPKARVIHAKGAKKDSLL